MEDTITNKYVLITDYGKILMRGNTREDVEKMRDDYILNLEGFIVTSKETIEKCKYRMNHIDEYNSSLRKLYGESANQYTKADIEEIIEYVQGCMYF